MADPAAPETPCADFDLADLIELDPAILLVAYEDDANTRAMKEMTLQLALAFNDFKLLAWTQDQLMKGKPKPDIVSPYAGQWVGMTVTLERLAAGLLWEITGVVRKHAKLIARSNEVRAAIARTEALSAGAAAAWRNVEATARGQIGERAALHRFYKETRNALAFHYKSAGDVLTGAYAQHFASDERDAAHAYAYVSLGESMERTRFYFADAAAQKALATAGQQISAGEMLGFVHDVNVALRFVVGALLERLKAAHERKLADSTTRR